MYIICLTRKDVSHVCLCHILSKISSWDFLDIQQARVCMTPPTHTLKVGYNFLSHKWETTIGLEQGNMKHLWDKTLCQKSRLMEFFIHFSKTWYSVWWINILVSKDILSEQWMSPSWRNSKLFQKALYLPLNPTSLTWSIK